MEYLMSTYDFMYCSGYSMGYNWVTLLVILGRYSITNHCNIKASF